MRRTKILWGAGLVLGLGLLLKPTMADLNPAALIYKLPEQIE